MNREVVRQFSGFVMPRLFETVTCLSTGADTIRRRRYGVIEVRAGALVGIHFRPWPKLISLPEVMFLGRHHHARERGQHCLVYYNQPLRFPNYLALTYVLSARDCTFATFHRALVVLDEIARVKRSDALLCEAWNRRISDRLLKRWGWEPHKPSRWHRHFIKRFYGNYPPPPAHLDEIVGSKPSAAPVPI